MPFSLFQNESCSYRNDILLARLLSCKSNLFPYESWGWAKRLILRQGKGNSKMAYSLLLPSPPSLLTLLLLQLHQYPPPPHLSACNSKGKSVMFFRDWTPTPWKTLLVQAKIHQGFSRPSTLHSPIAEGNNLYGPILHGFSDTRLLRGFRIVWKEQPPGRKII